MGRAQRLRGTWKEGASVPTRLRMFGNAANHASDPRPGAGAARVALVPRHVIPRAAGGRLDLVFIHVGAVTTFLPACNCAQPF